MLLLSLKYQSKNYLPLQRLVKWQLYEVNWLIIKRNGVFLTKHNNKPCHNKKLQIKCQIL